MNTLALHLPFATDTPSSFGAMDLDHSYATAAQTAALLRSGAQYRRERVVKSGRCMGVAHLRRGFKLPRWQFEPAIWPALQPLAKRLGTHDGWQLLAFLETPTTALDGQTPRAALEQGVKLDRILALATAEAH